MKKIMFITWVTTFLLFSTGTAFAASSHYGWQHDEHGWWWRCAQGDAAGSGWRWVDDDCDGIAECYCFDDAGYRLESTEKDGSVVNEKGQWIVNGEVQHKPFERNFRDLMPEGVDVYGQDGVEPVTDASTIPKIEFNMELADLLTNWENSLDRVPNRVPYENSADIYNYTVEYRGSIIKLFTPYEKEYNNINLICGPAKVVFNNFPEQGIELNAFYDSIGHENRYWWGRWVTGSTGPLDSMVGLPMYAYQVADVQFETGNSNDSSRDYTILVTPGDNRDIYCNRDYVWYIYPDSLVCIG